MSIWWLIDGEICWSMITMMVALCWNMFKISTSKLRKKWSLGGDSTFLAGLAANVQKFWTVVLCNQTSAATRGWNFALQSFREETDWKIMYWWCRISTKKPWKMNPPKKKNAKQSPNPEMEASFHRIQPPWIGRFHGKTEVVVVGFSESYVFRIFFKAAGSWFSPGNTVMFGFFLSWFLASMGFFSPLFSTASKVWTSSIRLFFITPLLKGKTVMFWQFVDYFSCFPSPRTHKRCCVCFRRAHKLTHLSSGWLAGHETLGRRSAEVLEQAWTHGLQDV